MKAEDKFYFGKHGQPERFDMEGACWEGYEPVGTKQKDGKTVPNCVPMKNAAGQEEEFGSWRNIPTDQLKGEADRLVRMWHYTKRNPGTIQPSSVRYSIDTLNSELESRGVSMPKLKAILSSSSYSRPGQPEKFDASSLDRGSFAEASTSPMLGKLLAAKVMPEGGWRAVQAGSDTLVISFEDADLARDFGRRVATKGYNATSPVQAIGRYWNVEVNNGK